MYFGALAGEYYFILEVTFMKVRNVQTKSKSAMSRIVTGFNYLSTAFGYVAS
jgi:hypothetical protein